MQIDIACASHQDFVRHALEDIVACLEINATMYMRSARRLRSTRHYRSPGNELEHTTRHEEQEIGQHEEDKELAKEIGKEKARKE